MATKTKKIEIGTMNCLVPGCGKELPVFQSETGTLHYSCQWCQKSDYVKKEEKSHGLILKLVKLNNKPAPDPVKTSPEIVEVKKPEPTPTLKPEPRVRNSVFDL